MAYAAVICLRTTITRLLSSSHFSIVSPTRRSLEFAYEELDFVQKVLERSGGSSNRYGSTLNDLDGQIIGVVQELEDALESHELEISHPNCYGDVCLMRHISSSVDTVKKMKREYNEELAKLLPAREEKDHLVGLSDQLNQIKGSLVKENNNAYVFSIVGMAGIGKTALAKSIFNDPFISQTFECRAFVSVGQNYGLQELRKAILAQVIPDNDELETFLDSKRHLVVLDDVWDQAFWDGYFKYRCQRKAANGSRILLTTRSEQLTFNLGKRIGSSYLKMRFLNNQESWDLLRQKVFPYDVCPRELKNAGLKIAEKCEGLPLMLFTMASILSKSDGTPVLEQWDKAASHKRNSVFEDAYNQILPVLYPSYYNLPPKAKACFLYMAAFPPSDEICRSKLVNLWCSEGFLEADEPSPSVSLKSFASECFDRILFDQTVVSAPNLSSDGQKYRACCLHSVFRHLCRKELKSNEFMHIVDGSTESEKRKRRIGIYNNFLLNIKEVRDSMDSNPTARSLLCTGPYHRYQVPINFNKKLLRVCDALSIRFYEFPCEVLELVQLRYFAITCNENLPPSISKLSKLEYLIVHQHLSINSILHESYLPVEIWGLQELIHLEIVGRNLPNPPTEGVALNQLVKLLDVGACTCTEAILRSLPNLEKLRVQIQLTPNLDEPFSYLTNISKLDKLISLQCVIMNPMLKPGIVAIATPSLSISPSSITKITLSGLGYPWMYLETIAQLPDLRVLKLLMFAFQGEMWEVEEKGFLKLQFLKIEDSDLVQWKAGDGAFPLLSRMSLQSCYKLQELPKVLSGGKIEVADCNPVVQELAKKMHWNVSSSWDAESNFKNHVYDVYTIE